MPRTCVALVLPQPLGERLDRARQLLQPKRRHMPAHMTLVPPLALSAEDAERATLLVREVAAGHSPIAVALRGCDTFAPRSSTAYLRVVSGAEPIGAIAAALERAPFTPRGRPLHPHVTIANRASDTVISAALAAFADFAADVVIDSVTLFALTDEGWRPFSEGRMGGSRP